jgi:3',5'-cyclic-nucleotide phosphodiesterase
VRIKPGVGIAGTVAKDGNAINITDAYKDKRFSSKFDKATGFVTSSILAVPIMTSENEVIGVFQCVNKLIDSDNKLEETVSYFNSKDLSILTAFSNEVAETLNKHASQLQVMKAIADAHSEDFKKRRAGSMIRKKREQQLEKAAKTAGDMLASGGVKGSPSEKKGKRKNKKKEENTLEGRLEEGEKEVVNYSDSDFDSLNEEDASDSETTASERIGNTKNDEEEEEDFLDPEKHKRDREGEAIAFVKKGGVGFARGSFKTGEEKEKRNSFKGYYDELKLRRHSMLMRHHNVSHHSFNKFLLQSMGKDTRRKSIFMPRNLAETGASVNEGNLGSQFLSFDPSTHPLIADIENWHLKNIFTANINEMIETCVLMMRRVRMDQVYQAEQATLESFVTSIAHKYRLSNEYHNFSHALFVMHLTYRLIKSSNIYQLRTHDVLGMIVAALCHDVDHPGTDNDFEVHMQSDLAITYNDISVLENHHVATCFRTARMSEEHNIFANLDKKQYKHTRAVIIDCIIATDMKSHFNMVSEVEKSQSLDHPDKEKIAMRVLMHAADLGSLLSPPKDSLLWTERIMSEFKMQAEKCRANNINVPAHMADLDSLKKQCKLQVDFVDYIVAPIWSLLHRKDPKNIGMLVQNLRDSRKHFFEIANGDGEEEGVLEGVNE